MAPNDLESFFASLREMKPNPDWQMTLRERLRRDDAGMATDDVTFPTVVRLNLWKGRTWHLRN